MKNLLIILFILYSFNIFAQTKIESTFTCRQDSLFNVITKNCTVMNRMYGSKNLLFTSKRYTYPVYMYKYHSCGWIFYVVPKGADICIIIIDRIEMF